VRILVTGAAGQIGWELQRSLPALGTVVALERAQCDFTRPETVAAAVRDARPDVVVNAAAYTDVDGAERDETTATTVNAVSVGVVAAEARRLGALLVHFSTDYVFDGAKPVAYVETDVPRPLSAYGRSKLAGEEAVRAGGGDHLILRTAWVYAARRRNFVRTILRLAGQPAPLRVVDDQRGTPNWARTLADATGRILARAAEERRSGAFASDIFHLTSAGVASRYAFACAIVEGAMRHDPRAFPRRPEIVPIVTELRPGVAPRPQNSQLDGSRLAARFGSVLPDWQSDLTRCIEEITANGTRDGEPG
jgi:dTDP-4-dehydrorhamnose reductase